MADDGLRIDEDAYDAEVVLHGGNMTAVHRRGDVVLRQAGPWTETVQEVMRRAREAGVAGIPEPLGLAEDGREVVAFVPGEVPQYPMPSWVWHETVLRQAARLLRAWHDATADVRPVDPVWRLPAHEPEEVVCHNDFAPNHLVFDAAADPPRLLGVIDFDTMSPGPRIWDLAYLAYRLVPYLDEKDDEAPAAEHRDARLDLLMDAYGADFARRDLFTAMSRRLVELADASEEQAERTGRNELVSDARMYREDAERVSALALTSSG